MNLVIDIGNTRAKAALFQGNSILHQGVIELTDPSSVFLFLGDNQPGRLLISSVLKELPAFLEDLKKEIPSVEFTSSTPVPIGNNYRSAGTLGSDRLAAGVGAWKRYPGEPLLVVDAGTCIKYNYVSAEGVYTGGGISPGIAMRFKAMHAFTGRLPEAEPDYDFDILTGTTTRDSLLSGVMNGVVEEVDGMINRYNTQYKGLKTVLTGGNYHFFEKRLKNCIFAHPNIILEGLHEILEYNVRK
jgi:type III pantothenate kinase